MKRYRPYLIFAGYVVCSLIFCCVVAQWLCTIHSGESYGWLSGVWHGCCFIPNWILSLFSDRLLKAEVYTPAYNVWWWIFVIVSWASLMFGYAYAFIVARSFTKEDLK